MLMAPPATASTVRMRLCRKLYVRAHSASLVVLLLLLLLLLSSKGIPKSLLEILEALEKVRILTHEVEWISLLSLATSSS